MTLVERAITERAYAIALPKRNAAPDWNGIFASSCLAAGLNGRCIERLGDSLASVRQVVNGYVQKLEYCSFAGDGAFFASSIFQSDRTQVSFSQNGDLYFQIHLRGVARNIVDGQSSVIQGPICLLTYYPPNTTRVMRAWPNQMWVSGSISMNPQMLMSEFGIRLQDLPHPLGELLRGNLTEGFSIEIPLSESVERVLNSVWDCTDRSSLRHALMEARGREIVYWILHEAVSRSNRMQQQLASIGVKTSKIEKIQQILESELRERHSLQSLADRVGLSRTSLSLGFKRWSGMAVFEYLHVKRMERAWRVLEENRHSVQQIAAMIGYQDESAFSRAFRLHFGLQPSLVSRRQAGAF